MSSSVAEVEIDTRAQCVVVTEHRLTVDFSDGRTVSVPLAWYPRLVYATPAERENVEIWDDGLYWPDLNADVSFLAMLLGRKSGESPRSLQNWLDYRARGEKEPIPTLPLPPEMEEELKKVWEQEKQP